MYLHIEESYTNEAEFTELRADGTFMEEFKEIKQGLQGLLCTMFKIHTALCTPDQPQRYCSDLVFANSLFHYKHCG